MNTTKDTTYNGWTNYETWNVALWLDNDQGSQEMMMEMAEEYRHESISRFADAISEFIEEMNPLANDASMWSDLLSAALHEVDWHEIAEHYLADLEPEEVEEEDEEEDEEDLSDILDSWELYARTLVLGTNDYLYAHVKCGDRFLILDIYDFDYIWRDDPNTYSRE